MSFWEAPKSSPAETPQVEEAFGGWALEELRMRPVWSISLQDDQTSHLRAMASNLRVMASNLRAMASNHDRPGIEASHPGPASEPWATQPVLRHAAPGVFPLGAPPCTEARGAARTYVAAAVPGTSARSSRTSAATGGSDLERDGEGLHVFQRRCS